MTRPGCGDVDHPEPGYDSGPTHEESHCDYCGQGMCGDIETGGGFSCCSPGCLQEILDANRDEHTNAVEYRGYFAD